VKLNQAPVACFVVKKYKKFSIRNDWYVESEMWYIEQNFGYIFSAFTSLQDSKVYLLVRQSLSYLCAWSNSRTIERIFVNLDVERPKTVTLCVVIQTCIIDNKE